MFIGRHCCLWCCIASSELKKPPEKLVHTPLKRTLETLKEDHRRFLTEGKGNLKKAKEYNNCINEPFFDIPIDQVGTRNISYP